jgi:hypothetical protein
MTSDGETQTQEDGIMDNIGAGLRPHIIKAFERLREDGYFAEPDWRCCQTCGVAAVPDEKWDRYVFFHDQDADYLRQKNACYLNWGGDPEHIIRRLQESGLTVDWDGSEQVRILVTAQ